MQGCGSAAALVDVSTERRNPGYSSPSPSSGRVPGAFCRNKDVYLHRVVFVFPTSQLGKLDFGGDSFQLVLLKCPRLYI
jgi:hypothetical protein